MAKPKQQPTRLMLVDGHSVAFRAYHALPASLRDAEAQPANALYGFLSILFRVLEDQRPTHVAVTFDHGRPFREQLFPAYKAHRDQAPQDLEPQVQKLHRVLRVLRIPVFEVDGFEADDLLATLVHQATKRRIEIDVLSGDLDLLQLVGPRVRVVAPGKTFSEPIIYDEARVEERYGVPPGRLRDLKALLGDPSDGIPGVRGIGLKSASALIRRYGDLETVYQHLDSVDSPRVRRALAAGRDSAFLSRTLVELRVDAPIRLQLEPTRRREHDRDEAQRALRHLGFEHLAERLPDL